MNTTTKQLNGIVRGPWDKGADFYECSVNTGNPDYLSLYYTIREDRRNVDVHQYRAQVNANGPGFEVKLHSHGKTAKKAMEALLGEWRDEIERFMGTIHPVELGEGMACLDLRPVNTDRMNTDRDGNINLNFEMDSPWCVLIVSARDFDDTFTAQTGGVMCNHPTYGGALIDLGGENMPRKDPGRGDYEESVERVIESIPNPAIRELLEPRGYGTAQEAWVKVKVSEDADVASDWMRGQDAVLAYPNSD